MKAVPNLESFYSEFNSTRSIGDELLTPIVGVYLYYCTQLISLVRLSVTFSTVQ